VGASDVVSELLLCRAFPFSMTSAQFVKAKTNMISALLTFDLVRMSAGDNCSGEIIRFSASNLSSLYSGSQRNQTGAGGGLLSFLPWLGHIE
jgi:hypothetical protein